MIKKIILASIIFLVILGTIIISNRPYQPDLFIAPVKNISDDFIKGVDISSLIALEESGVIYYDQDGDVSDLIQIMADAGVNYIRVRVWNNPYNYAGNGYGGGNNDIKKAVSLGKRATKENISLMVDFHYSDFWADPSKQQSPKAWNGFSIEEKADAVYKYTKESIKLLLDNDIKVGMVQLGNETNSALAGETNWKNISTLMHAGSRAIRELNKTYKTEMLIAVHFTNPEREGNYERYAKILENFNVDYDVFASSYYPFWHGSLENLTKTLTKISKDYNKKVIVAEFSYAYTYENGDEHTNSIGDESVFEKKYPISVQGQANAIRDIIKAVADIGDAGLGVVYWEPAWLGVPGESFEAQSEIWEKYGSGWASSYAVNYESEDAGKLYGGSSWDNQALFDFEGHPLDSLYVYRNLKEGLTTDIRVDTVDPIEVKVRVGDELTLPTVVKAINNNGSTIDIPVNWSLKDIEQVDVERPSIYKVTGETENHLTFAIIKVMAANYVENFGFEEQDMSDWSIENIDEITSELGVLEKATDAKSDNNSFHFYSTNKVAFRIEQTISNLKPGLYNYSMFIQGGDASNQDIHLYAIVDEKRYIKTTDIDGYLNWKNPKIESILIENGEITIGAYISCDTKGWGTLDDFYLTPIEER
jgi:arabinogalactan endo-1,4-beta-galactosidase